jgi:5'-nucleotidase
MNAKGMTFAALLAALLLTGAGQSAQPVTVQLLAINDFHGSLEPPPGADGRVNEIAAGGAEYLATHLRNAVRDNPNSILVGAGDLMGVSQPVSGLFQDAPTIAALNAMHLAVSSIGNHELDPGPEELLRRIRGARYQYLAANVVRARTPGETLLPATAVRSVGGVKIGFIGETLEGTGAIIAASSAKNLRFLEESSVANKAAAQLERQGVHAIVLLIHQGGTQYPASGPADPNGCVNFDGAIKDLAAKLSPAIRVVISGHTHQFYNCEIAGHVVTSAGSYGRMFTRVSLGIDPATDRILTVSARNEVVTRDVAKDAAETAVLEKYRPGAARVADKKEGSVTEPFDRTENQAGESKLGDVIADVQLAATAPVENGGAVVAFMNGTGIRTNIDRVQVSYGDLYRVQPFSNRLMVQTMTGDMIRRLLEQQFSENGRPDMLQVSAGFTYQYKLHAPAGGHVVAGSIALNGHAIAPDEPVRVEASDFLAGGGNGFSVFNEGKNVTAGPLDLDALLDYFRGHSPVAPGPQNRIIRVD